MAEYLTEDDLTEIAARLDAAPAGPWMADTSDEPVHYDRCIMDSEGYQIALTTYDGLPLFGENEHDTDALTIFLANSWVDVRRLIGEVLRLRDGLKHISAHAYCDPEVSPSIAAAVLIGDMSDVK